MPWSPPGASVMLPWAGIVIPLARWVDLFSFVVSDDVVKFDRVRGGAAPAANGDIQVTHVVEGAEEAGDVVTACPHPSVLEVEHQWS